jgi:hypothetical protein
VLGAKFCHPASELQVMPAEFGGSSLYLTRSERYRSTHGA